MNGEEFRLKSTLWQGEFYATNRSLWPYDI